MAKVAPCFSFCSASSNTYFALTRLVLNTSRVEEDVVLRFTRAGPVFRALSCSFCPISTSHDVLRLLSGSSRHISGCSEGFFSHLRAFDRNLGSPAPGKSFNVDGALCDLIYIHSASTASHQLPKSLGAAILQTRSLLVLRPLSIVVP